MKWAQFQVRNALKEWEKDATRRIQMEHEREETRHEGEHMQDGENGLIGLEFCTHRRTIAQEWKMKCVLLLKL